MLKLRRYFSRICIGVSLAKSLEHVLDVSILSCKDTELLRESHIVVLSALLHEVLNERDALFDEIIIVVTDLVLFRNGRDIDTGPPLSEGAPQSEELLVSAQVFERSIGIDTCHDVIDMSSNFNWILYCELLEL